MRVLIGWPDRGEIEKTVQPALEQAGCAVIGCSLSADTLMEKLETLRPDLLILRMDLARRGEEEDWLARLNVPAIVVLPRGRANLRERLAAHPNVRGVAVAPDVDFARLVGPVGATKATRRREPAWAGSARPAADEPSPIPPVRKRAPCLVFVGVKGGVGTTTALCALAAGAGVLGLGVGIVDLTATGDACATMTEHERIRFIPVDRAGLSAQWPALRAGYDLVLVDLGRLPALPIQGVGALTFHVTRPDTTDRLPGDASHVVVTQADRAPVGLKAVAVLPTQPDLYTQIAGGRFLQPGPLLDAAVEWADTLRRNEVRS